MQPNKKYVIIGVAIASIVLIAGAVYFGTRSSTPSTTEGSGSATTASTPGTETGSKPGESTGTTTSTGTGGTTTPTGTEKKSVLKEPIQCGPGKQLLCGVVDVKVEFPDDKIVDHRIFLAFKNKKAYEELQGKLPEDLDKLPLPELKKLFGNIEETKIGEDTLYSPNVQKLFYTSLGYVQPDIGKIVELVKLGGFKSYMDTLDGTDFSLWQGEDVFLVMPLKDEDKDKVKLVNDEVGKIELITDGGEKPTVENVKVFSKPAAYRGTYYARLAKIKNIFKTKYSALHVEFTYNQELKDKFSQNDLDTTYSNPNYFANTVGSGLESSYKGLRLLARYEKKDRSIIEVAKNIEDSGVKAELEAQIKHLGYSGLLSNFSILIIGEEAKIEELAGKLKAKDEPAAA